MQGGRADLTPDPEAMPGDPLVAEEADQRGRRDHRDVVQGARVDQPLDRGPGREGTGRSDRQHDHDAREVLRPAVAVGEAARRRRADPGRTRCRGGRP